MARLNISILGSSGNKKWMRMSKFNSDDHYVCYCEQESLRRNAVTLMVNKRVQNDNLTALGISVNDSLKKQYSHVIAR